ncbi:type II toxin-antitoxin system RelE/ParE family toxin [Mesorhizobium neociceri]|uniref:Type II toxin-antitoxin system RelE/ParE family toxin n=1 Tax=Mesorhizobium neociceri TaxID=1307853 RepID=A0A838BHT4_9HYPH|nr:type II toxin-antitoxin system RelE/ParE family toxin [Mesorhizobium neociceri]MBA1145034.1 type II toxin-antitoxin system RelE/ParE family toxin [Mesorhizobium neociceri]
MHCVTETHSFNRAASEAGMDDDDVARLKNFLAANPDAGALIQGTGGARKLRFAKPGRGKSGSYRVITYYTADDIPVFLMDVYTKGEKINLTAKEKAELKKELESFADEYRAMIREKVQEMKRSEVAS